MVEKYRFWVLEVFITVPLPDSLITVMLDMRMKRAFPGIVLDVAAEDVIVSFVTYGVGALFIS